MLALDRYASQVPQLHSPCAHLAAVTPSDTNDLAEASRYLYVGHAGDVAVNTVGGETAVVLASVPAGTTLPIRATRVLATGTTATGLVALW